LTGPLLLSAIFLVAFLAGAASGALWRHWARVRAVDMAEAERRALRGAAGRAAALDDDRAALLRAREDLEAGQ
jgi:hypothetical protein